MKYDVNDLKFGLQIDFLDSYQVIFFNLPIGQTFLPGSPFCPIEPFGPGGPIEPFSRADWLIGPIRVFEFVVSVIKSYDYRLF